ncbi:exocyst complex component EXO70E2-like [Typha latifolia]|uniref:exocyst complex component EXO70E2-like n=1 Tax=Typha latifolia TaxID=4733 RepID=UPI003C2C26BD
MGEGGKEVLNDDMIKIIGDLDTRYSNMSLAEEEEVIIDEKRLKFLLEKVLTVDSNHSMICCCDPEEASGYLQTVNEIQQLMENLRNFQFSNEKKDKNELLVRADDILEMVMPRIEEEFVHLLVNYQQPLEPDHMSFRSTEDDSVYDYSSSSFGEEPIEGKIQSDSSANSEEFVVDLINPCALSTIKSIAKLMFLCNYDKECCHAYISVRKEALDECLSDLRIENFSIEELLNLDWKVLSGLIKRWNRALKVFIRVYLASERRLCNIIFGDLLKSVEDSCFIEISKSSFVQLLSFADAVAIGPPKPERLFRRLDMYGVLDDLLIDIKSLFPEEYGYSILTECHEVLLGLRESVRRTFTDFKYSIRSNTSTTAFPGGGVHPLTKYVMNYMNTLPDYSETLDSLLEDENGDNQYSSTETDGRKNVGFNPSAMSSHLLSLTDALELNLEGRSKLYKDDSLQHIFMMNNICYMVQKVKDSELKSFLGDNWIRVHNRKFRQHEMSYERASWSSVLFFLREEGICPPRTNAPSKTVLKERFKGFNLSFEEVYRIQTAWLVPNVHLRDDLRISISLKVLQAYRTFMGRHRSHMDGVKHRERYIKYCADDLEKYLLDLFEGSPKSLQHTQRW